MSSPVRLVWQAGQDDPAVASARTVFDRINAATGSTYNDTLFGGRVIGDSHTYHPLGGCPLGRATDDYGRIPDHPQLCVLDGSLIPIGIGAIPSLTMYAARQSGGATNFAEGPIGQRALSRCGDAGRGDAEPRFDAS